MTWNYKSSQNEWLWAGCKLWLWSKCPVSALFEVPPLLWRRRQRGERKEDFWANNNLALVWHFCQLCDPYHYPLPPRRIEMKGPENKEENWTSNIAHGKQGEGKESYYWETSLTERKLNKGRKKKNERRLLFPLDITPSDLLTRDPPRAYLLVFTKYFIIGHSAQTQTSIFWTQTCYIAPST